MAKGMMIIDGQRVSFDGEKNVLSVIRKAGIEMPTFCYYSDLSVYGACRMCVVENEETGKIDASCSMEPDSRRSESMGRLFWRLSGPRESWLQQSTGTFSSLAMIFSEREISATS